MTRPAIFMAFSPAGRGRGHIGGTLATWRRAGAGFEVLRNAVACVARPSFEGLQAAAE